MSRLPTEESRAPPWWSLQALVYAAAVERFRITARPATPKLAAALLAELDKAGVEVVISPPMPQERRDGLSVADLAVSTLTFVVKAADPETVRAAVRRVYHLLGGKEADIEVEPEPDES
jgi:hypothetical protein